VHVCENLKFVAAEQEGATVMMGLFVAIGGEWASAMFIRDGDCLTFRACFKHTDSHARFMFHDYTLL
jgi:hypothetical protein